MEQTIDSFVPLYSSFRAGDPIGDFTQSVMPFVSKFSIRTASLAVTRNAERVEGGLLRIDSDQQPDAVLLLAGVHC
jgi:hypothetical protein